MNNIIFLKTHLTRNWTHTICKRILFFSLGVSKNRDHHQPFSILSPCHDRRMDRLGGQSQQPLDGHDMVIGFGRVTWSLKIPGEFGEDRLGFTGYGMLWHNWDLGRMKIHMWHRNPRIGTSASLVFWAFGHLMHISFCRWLPIYRGRHLVTCHPIIIVYLLITITVFRIYNTRMISHQQSHWNLQTYPTFHLSTASRWSFHSSWHPGIPACWWTAFLPRLGIGVSPLHLGMLGHQVLETKKTKHKKVPQVYQLDLLDQTIE